MKVIKKIKLAKIEKIIAGGSNGSIILIDLAKDSDKYIIYIYCAWRLSFGKKILTGWNDIDKVFVAELKKITNDVIVDVKLNSLGDFSLLFESGIKLDVFCDITSKVNDTSIDENWSLCDISNNQCYNFTNQFSFIMEPYDNSLNKLER